jgi:hypothetical protein
VPVTRFVPPPPHVVNAMAEAAANNLESFALARGLPAETARNAFQVFYLPVAQLRDDTRTTLEPVRSGWCYLQQGDRGFEVVEIFEPRDAGAEYVRHRFGDAHPMAGAVAGTLSPDFTVDVEYELRLLLVPPLLQPALWIAPTAGGTEWFMPVDANVEGMVSGMWYDATAFADLLRTEARRFNWEIQP